MKYKLNAYLAALFVTVAGAGATMIIVHVATDYAISSTFGGSETVYAPLQRSILNQHP